MMDYLEDKFHDHEHDQKNYDLIFHIFHNKKVDEKYFQQLTVYTQSDFPIIL